MELIKWETCMRSGPNIRSNTIVELKSLCLCTLKC